MFSTWDIGGDTGDGLMIDERPEVVQNVGGSSCYTAVSQRLIRHAVVRTHASRNKQTQTCDMAQSTLNTFLLPDFVSALHPKMKAYQQFGPRPDPVEGLWPSYT